MASAGNNEEIKRLSAALRAAELRLQANEQARNALEDQRAYSDHLFSVAFNESPEAITLSRASDGVFVDVNREWLRLTGFTREEVLGRTAVEIGHSPNDVDRDSAMAPLLKSGHLRDLELMVNMKDGAQRLVRLNGSVINVAGVPHLLIYVKDITPERMAAEALRSGELALEHANARLNEQLKLFELTENLARVGHWMANPQGELVRWSEGLHSIVGTRPGGSMPTSALSRSRIHKDDLAAFVEARQKMDGRTIEFRLLLVDGTWRWMRSRMHRQLSVDGMLCDFGLVQDITAERAVTQALREKLEFIEKITSLIPDVVFQYQTEADGRIWFPFISEGARRMFRVSPEEARRDARSVFAAIHPDDRAETLRTMDETGFDGASWTHEFRVKFDDGVEHWLLGHAVTRGGADGALVSYGSITDISERKEAEARLQESEARFRSLTELSSEWYWEIDDQFRFSRFDGYRLGRSVVTQTRSMGKTRWELGALNMTEEDWLAHRLVLESHQQFKDLELQRLDADGLSYWISVSGTPIFDIQGQFGGYRGIGRDISMRKHAEARVLESEARFKSLTDLSSDWYWEIDEEFRYTRVDGFRQRRSTVNPVSLLGKRPWEVVTENLSEEDWLAHRAILEAHQGFKNFELQRGIVDGKSYWTSVTGTPIFDAQGQFRGYRGVGSDISGRKHAEEATQRLAFYDTLTGMPNRRLMLDRLSHALASSARNRQQGALLFIDLDNFKDINDTLGHDVGDELLKQVAHRLVTCIRESDTAARFGGDEFVVMLEDLSSIADEAANQAEHVAEKILSRLNDPYDLQGKQHSSTPSIGVTLFCGNEFGTDELFKRADLAMYQAKAAGRNTVRFFDPQMQAAIMARAALDADLRQGLQRQELLLHYQPVVDIAGRMTGLEALVRWQHPQRGLVPPGEFITLAEQTGLILPLGQWVLQTACRQLVAWAGRPNASELSIAVNVSARQFRQPDFVTQVLATLQETGANPQRLKLELTESVLVTDVEDAIRKMGALRELGVRFALDDFGTGYSSLSYLKRLPLDQLKIDQSFVRDVLSDSNDAAIVRTILALARSMDLVAVAEGVETEGQRQFLLDNGCTVFQGYLFGRPVPLDKLILST